MASPLMGEGQLTAAREMAEALQLNHRVLYQKKLPEAVKANGRRRCYHCKKELFQRLQQLACGLGIQEVAHGAIEDDVGDFRPGEQAAKELQILAPLQAVGLTKVEIRSLSRELGLPHWDRLATVCLASRIRYGLELTPARLELVQEAEAFLRQLVAGNLRLRIHDEATLRLEVDVQEMDQILVHREAILSFFSQWNYSYLTLELVGYQSGSMNRVLEVDG